MSTNELAGLRWRKLDLHVHTPASLDYTGRKDITPEEFITTAIAKGLDGIAVTDHNSAAWVDQILAAAKGTRLVVFPGVVISATGGEGIHRVAIFDCSASAKTVESLLAKVQIDPKVQGKPEAISPLSPLYVIQA